MKDCFGQFDKQPSNKCEKCETQKECYEQMAKEEKAKTKTTTELPWYKRSVEHEGSCAIDRGMCE